MAIGVDQIYLSMTSPETGEYLTANVYTVDGVMEADGKTPRLLSIGQLVMAICLQRAYTLENGVWDARERKYVDGIIPIMEDMNDASEQLKLMTKIENEVLAGNVDMSSSKVTYGGVEYTYYQFLAEIVGVNDVPTGTANAKNSEFITSLESMMDQMNTFSQEKMIELQSYTNKRDQAYDMISNVLKSLNTTLVGNVNNM